MNLTKYYGAQHQLDQNILITQGLVDNESLIEDKIFAFHVEIGEAANEFPFFKFWKTKPYEKSDKLLEELIDCFHFLLSIGISRKYNRFVSSVSFDKYLHTPVRFLFQELMNNPLNCTANYTRALETLIALIHVLGFDLSQIEHAYFAKLEINHTRQTEGY
jgi:dimeric dUTPase (all-alpha-NTP-PPase superfamily)